MAFTQITTQVIAANAVTQNTLANNAVLNRNIGWGQITGDKLAANVVDVVATAPMINNVQSNLNTVQSNVYNVSSGLSGANTNILNIQTGLAGTNNNLSGNVAIFNGAFTGSNSRLAGAESNVIALQGGLSGSNTTISTNSLNITNLQTGLLGSNTRISGAESNVIALQGGLASANLVISASNTASLVGGLAGANTNILNLQSGLSGSNTRITNEEANTLALQGGISGSNTRIAGAESNVIALQGGLSGSNTINTNQTTGLIGANNNIANLQVGLSGSNTRISGSESNIITLQSFATSTQSNIASIISGSTQFTGNVTMQKSLIIQGNLHVVGSQVDLGVASTSIYDSIITLNGNLSSSSPPPADTGFLINRGSSTNVFIGIEVGETSDPHLHVAYTDSPGTNVQIAYKGYLDIHANAYHANGSSLQQAAFSMQSDTSTGIHFPNSGIVTIISSGTPYANVTATGNLELTTGYIQTTGSTFNSLDLKTTNMANGVSIRSVSNVSIFLDHNNDSSTDSFNIFTNTGDPSISPDSAIFSIREQNSNVYSKGSLNFISANATTDLYSGNAVISSKIYSNGVELRANDYATYLTLLGGLSGSNTVINNLQTGLVGSNTNILDLQTGLSGSNTRISGNQSNISTLQSFATNTQSNVVSLQGGISGSNTRISGTESNITIIQAYVTSDLSNVLSLQGSISGSNTRIVNLESNVLLLQGGISGSNNRIVNLESNVLYLQGGLNSANSNIYSTYITLSSNDYITYTRLNANLNTVSSNVNTKLSLSGGTMSGPISMGNQKITNLADPTSGQDAATRAYVLSVTGGTTLVQQYTTNISSGTSNVIAIAINTPLTISRILVSLAGVIQTPFIDFIHNEANSSIQYTDANIPAGLTTVIQSWA